MTNPEHHEYQGHPRKFPQVNAAGARALADFLLSENVQHSLLEFGRQTNGLGPLFFPVEAVPQ